MRHILSRYHHHIHTLSGSFFSATSRGEQPSDICFLSFCGAKIGLQPRHLQFLCFYITHSSTHTHTHTQSQYDSSKHVISPSQTPLPTQHTAHKRDEYHAVSGTRTHVPSNGGVAYLRVKLHGHGDRHRIVT